MKEYIVMAKEVWSYHVEADTPEQAEQMVFDDPSTYRNEIHTVEVFDVEDRNERHNEPHDYDPNCDICLWLYGKQEEERNESI